MVELMIAVGLFSILVMAMMQPMVMSASYFKKAMDMNDRNQNLILFEKIIDKYLNNVSPLRFDPTLSLYLDATDNLAYVGPTWNLNGLVFPSATYQIKTFTVNPLPAMVQDSFNIEMYSLTNNGSSLNKKTIGLLTSRCITYKTYVKPTTAAQVMALSVAVVEATGFRCCTPGNLSSCSAINPPDRWPTVFTILDGGIINSYPDTQDRNLVPGFGANIIFSSTTPRNYLIRSIRIRNVCKTTMVQYQRSCANTVEGAQDQTYFNEDITFEIKEILKPVISDVTDSSFIGLGNDVL